MVSLKNLAVAATPCLRSTPAIAASTDPVWHSRRHENHLLPPLSSSISESDLGYGDGFVFVVVLKVAGVRVGSGLSCVGGFGGCRREGGTWAVLGFDSPLQRPPPHGSHPASASFHTNPDHDGLLVLILAYVMILIMVVLVCLWALTYYCARRSDDRRSYDFPRRATGVPIGRRKV
uniref:Uncharacterized protein n=1 Tax=Fagus sylvatica TaxID=28930 RepID=A0A2N9FWL3_FAGSY